jgi:hypothetical protein
MIIPTNEQLAIVNQLLPHCSPGGAYSLGAICSLAWRDNLELPRELLEKAAACASVQQVDILYSEYRNYHDPQSSTPALDQR